MPKYPHRLLKPPSKMNKSELAVLVGLAGSVSLGLYEMGSSLYSCTEEMIKVVAKTIITLEVLLVRLTGEIRVTILDD